MNDVGDSGDTFCLFADAEAFPELNIAASPHPSRQIDWRQESAPRGMTVESLDDLANLLTLALGQLGGPIFYLGVFAVLYSSVIGNAVGNGYLMADIVHVCQSREPTQAGRLEVGHSRVYRAVAAWCLFSPLIWNLPGMPSFIALTIIANAAAVVVLPILCGGLWYLTARTAFIGPAYRNKWWENTVLAGLFILSLWGAYHSVVAITNALYIA